MATGYGGTYRGSVVSVDDPQMESRLSVLVPEIFGTDAVWARPSRPAGDVAIPAVGDDVWVSFEHGDSDYPVWEPSVADDRSQDAPSGYIGKYRAIVVDDSDPQMEKRLQVSVPEVLGDAQLWATPGLLVGPDDPLPTIGTEVWVEFEHGDPSYPVWVGTG
jgi:hypothetical protein